MTDLTSIPSTPAAARRRRRLAEESGLFLILLAMVLGIGIPYPEFFSLGSMKTILRQSAYVGIIAFGMVYLVAMVEIDLSVGGIYAVAGTVVALLVKYLHIDPWVAVAFGLLAGAALGAINGVLTSLLKVPLIIVSLGTLSAFFGLNLIISNGDAIYGLPTKHPFFTILGGDILGMPASVWTAAVCGIALHILLLKTRFGATVRAIGSNPAAAQFIGVRTWLITIYATALVGFLSAVSGILTLAQFTAVDPSTGRTLGLQVIAGVVIGGTSLAGGSGTIIGTALGVLIITTIDSGLVRYGVNPNYSEFVTGIVILFAIALDRIVKRRRAD
jgi:ribose transport system permease protein